jgi:hypothetical protein
VQLNASDGLLKMIASNLDASGHVFIVEKVARGGGNTRWFYCESIREVEDVLRAVRSGSLVGLFFDDRIRRLPKSEEAEIETIDAAIRYGELFLGTKNSTGSELRMYLADPNEVYAEVSKVASGEMVYFAPIPTFDNDGKASIVFTAPDADGVVRPQPV